MYTELETLLKFTTNYGLSLLITGIVLWFLVKWIHAKLFPPARHQDEPEQFDIQEHSFFTTVSYIIQIGIHRLFFQNRFKQVVFTDMLVVIFQVMEREIHALLQSDILQESRSGFERKMTQALTDMILQTEHEIRKELTPHFANVPEGIEPTHRLIIKYNQVFESHNELLFQAVRDVCQSALFRDNKQRLSSLLYVLKMLSLLVMLNAERVLAEMNGEFAGWSYKGIQNGTHRIERREQHDP